MRIKLCYRSRVASVFLGEMNLVLKKWPKSDLIWQNLADDEDVKSNINFTASTGKSSELMSFYLQNLKANSNYVICKVKKDAKDGKRSR